MSVSVLIRVGTLLLLGSSVAMAQGTLGGYIGYPGQPPRMDSTPYSADTVTVSDRTLADGNHIHHETHGKIYRDSQGRMRTDTELRVPAEAADVVRVFINDPVQRVSISLNPDLHTATITHFPDPAKIAVPRAAIPANTTTQTSEQPKVDIKHEDLGTQEIEGVLARGTRTTRTIPSGAEGNDQPIVVVIESWTSQELGTGVLRKSSDPRLGTSEHRLTNIQRGEPDPALFQVPADYKVKDNGTPQ